MATPYPTLAARLTRVFSNTVFVLSTYHCITEYLVELAVCSGHSMEPTLYKNDILVIARYISNPTALQRGDIVVIKSPSDPRKCWCKRLIGLPGDRISNSAFFSVIPMGHVWLEGDNKLSSHDSRNVGPLPQGLIQGKALFTLWPFMRDLRTRNYFKSV